MPRIARAFQKNFLAYLLVFLPAFYMPLISSDNTSWAWLWLGPWFALLVGLWGAFVYWAYTQYTWQVWLPASYMLAECVWYFSYRDTFYGGYTYKDILLIYRSAAYCAATVVGFLVLFALLKAHHISRIKEAFGWLGVINCLVVFWQKYQGIKSFELTGLLGNASMNTCLILAMAPLLVTRIKILHTLPIIVLALTQRTTPICVAAILYPMWVYRTRPRLFPSCVLLVIAGLAIAVATHQASFLDDKKVFFNDSGRLDIWAMGLRLFWENYGWAGRIFGFGPGVSALWLPQTQLDTHTAEIAGFWIWWHNDYLQFLFDFGLFGCLLVTLVLLFCKRFFKAIDLSTGLSLLTLALSALVNYPLRVASGSFLIATLLLPLFRKQSLSQRYS